LLPKLHKIVKFLTSDKILTFLLVTEVIGVLGLLAFGAVYRITYVTGNSMSPTLKHHDILIIQIQFFQRNNLGNGTIITFDYTKNFSVCHRIINICDDANGIFYITKGDHNKWPDNQKVRPNNITGIVVGVFPF